MRRPNIICPCRLWNGCLLYLCVSFALIWLFRRAERKWLLICASALSANNARLRELGMFHVANGAHLSATRRWAVAFMDKLIVEDLHKKYGTNEVLKGVSLQAKAGDVISIIGSSGSGKVLFFAASTFWSGQTPADTFEW